MRHSPESPAGQIATDVLDSLLEGCQVIGFDWTYLYVNDVVAAQARRPEEQLTGLTMMECFPGIDATPMFAVLKRCMATRKHDRLENEFTYPDGSKGWFELRFVPVPEGTCILSLDITEARRAAEALARTEDQLRQAQKMDAVGRLAGGVAHDFNNLLSVVLSYAELVLEQMRPDDPTRADLLEIKRAGERGADLTRQLLTFSRHQVVEARVVDLNEVVTDMDRMIRRLLGADVEIRTVPAREAAKVRLDRVQIEQVIMNLVVNARDAMPRGGKLTIETQHVELDAAYAEQHVGVTPGPHVMLAVSDTGTGMDKATQQRIFEPFFTTKDKGKGTGIGLSTVFGIVQQSRGNVWVYSEPGKGTTFKVYFPRTDAVEAAAPAPLPLPTATFRGTETVLLVENEAALRAVARDILSRNGYRVLEAGTGQEAMLLCERHDQPIHLLLTDVVMPELSGAELAERVQRARPEILVLYMSGYTEEAVVHHQAGFRGAGLLQKPITPDALLRRVREVLDGRSPSRGP